MSRLLPFFLTHPWTLTAGVFVLQAIIIQGLPLAWKWIEKLTGKLQSFCLVCKVKAGLGEIGERGGILKYWRKSFWRQSHKTFPQQVIDDDLDSAPHSTSLTNQKTSIPVSTSAPSFRFPIFSFSSSLPTTPQKAGERRECAWTGGRGGWSPVVGNNPSDVGIDNETKCWRSLKYRSNLTFSLAPGWGYVETEDRKSIWDVSGRVIEVFWRFFLSFENLWYSVTDEFFF